MSENKDELKNQKKKFWNDKKNIVIIVLAILLSISLFNFSSSINYTEYENRISELNKQVEKLKDDSNKLQGEIEHIKQEKNDLTEKNEKLTNEKNALEEQKKTLEEEKQQLNSKIEELNKKIYTSSPSNSAVTKKATSNTPVQNTNSETVYITKTGNKYHKSWCSYLRKSKIAISLDNAKSQGYTACSRCH